MDYLSAKQAELTDRSPLAKEKYKEKRFSLKQVILKDTNSEIEMIKMETCHLRNNDGEYLNMG